MQDFFSTHPLNVWPWIEFLATWWLQASILLTIGLLTALALRRPAYQSTVFRASLIAVLLCPFVALAVHLTGVAVLTLDLRQRFDTIETSIQPVTTAISTSTGLSPINSEPNREPMFAVAGSVQAERQVSQSPAQTITNQQSTDSHDFQPDMAPVPPALSPRVDPSFALNPGVMIAWLVIGTWLVGALVFGLGLSIDLQRARRLVMQSAPADQSCVRCCHQLAAQFRTRNPVVLINPLLSSPCLVGQWRPVILLPEDTPVEHYQRVFLHELAHLKRADWAWSIVGRATCSLLWFHPLAWWLHRSHLSIAEDICDDYVIQHDGNREDYLQQLIEIAQHSIPNAVPAGLSIVGFRSKLGKRALRILDTTRALSTQVSQRFLAAALAAALVLVSSVALLEIGHSQAAVSEPESSTNEILSQDKSAANGSADNSDNQSAARTYTGRISNADGQPISGAKVTVITDQHIRSQRRKSILTEVISDRDGDYALTFPSEDGQTTVRVTAPGYGEDFVDRAVLDELAAKNETKLDFRLNRSQAITGRVVNTEGKPVAGAQIQILRVSLPTSDEAVAKWSLNSYPDRLKGLQLGQDPRVTETMFPTRATYENTPGLFSAIQTDSDGRFQVEGFSQNTLLHLRLSGPSMAVQEFQLVGRTMQTIHAFGYSVRNDDYRHYGNDSTLVVSPTQRIRGRVVDAQSKQPLAGVPVVVMRLGKSVWLEDAITSATDQHGQFELTGAPLGGEHVVEVRPPNDQPYFETRIELPRSDEPVFLSANFQLTKTHWIRGRVTDEHGNPVVARLNLHPFRDNPHAANYPNFDPRISGQSPDKGTLTNEQGEFRIKAIPGHSLLTAFAADYNLNPLYYSNRPDGLLERIGGEQMPKVLHPFSADFFDALTEIELSPTQEEITQNLVLKKGIDRKLKLVGSQGQTIDSVDILGLTWVRALQPNAKLENSSLKITGLGPNESRVVVAITPDGLWGKHLNISGQESSVVETQLQRCCTIRGRVLNPDADPANKLLIRVSVENSIMPDNWMRELKPVVTDELGEFSTRVPPGGKYTITHYSSAGPNFFVRIQPTAGDDYNLGDLVAGASRIVSDASEYRMTRADAVTSAATAQPQNLPESSKDVAQNQPLPTTRVRGKVVDQQDTPIAGANVALVAVKKAGQFFTGSSEVLAAGITNAQGQFELETGTASSQTHGEVRLIVRAKDTALQTRPVELGNDQQDLGAIALPPQNLVRVKLVDLEGNPARNIRVEVQSVLPRPQDGTEFGTLFHRFTEAPPAWIGPLTTDEQGLLTVPGLANNQGVYLLVQPSDKFAIQGIALNTGWKEERAENDATYRSIVKNLKANEVATIPLAPARIFEGTVRLGKNGPPAANTKVQIWASQQELFGSMISVEGQTDAQGHYRIIPYPGVRFGVQAYPPEQQPYQISQVQNLRWDDTKSTLVTDIDLPECILARGHIVDAGTGQPVVDASVQYWPMETNPNDREGIISGWQGIQRTNAKGEFAIPVLPGEGWLIVQAIGSSYAIQTMHQRQLFSGKPGGHSAYAHAFEKLNLPQGQQPQPLRIALQRGQDVRLEVVDPNGEPVEDAQVFSRLMLSEDLIAGWRGFRAPQTRRGLVTLQGINEDGDIPVYILDAKRQLGATILINRTMKSAKARLQPCGKATISLCNEEGQRTSGLEIVFAMIVTPGSSMLGDQPDPTIVFADADYLPNLDQVNHRRNLSDERGQFTVPALIPGATYRYFDYDQKPHDFQARSGETIQLGSLHRKM